MSVLGRDGEVRAGTAGKRPLRLQHRFSCCAVIAVAAGWLSAQASPAVFPLRNPSELRPADVKAKAATYLGRASVQLTVEGEDRHGLVLLPGTDFQDGVIEADIALRPTTPPDVRNPGFAGIAFRVRSDSSHYELFYLRPGNSQAPDQAMRNHSVQYVSEPDFGWYPLRREWPSVYESHAELATLSWTRLRIEVAGRTAKLYLNGSSKPSLVVDGLKGEDLRGAVGLWCYTDEEAYFSNVRISPTAALSVSNGSDAAGSWEMHYSSDAGPMDALMELHRDGSQLSGTWSGPLGEARAISGTWRNGYVELGFAGEWPKDRRNGAAGAVSAVLEGWIDGDAAKGRLRVEGRADGVWTARRRGT
jgi:hypothetical protein